MGGKSTEIVQPTAPPAPSTADAIREFVNVQPQLFRLQQRQAPQEAQLQVDLAQQFAEPLGQAIRDAQRAINPEVTELQDELARQALEGTQQGLSQEEEDFFADTFKSLAGNQVTSGLGADFVSSNLLRARQARQDQFRNLGLSLAGFQPLAQPGAANVNNFSGSLTPGQFLGAQSQNFSTQASAGRPLGFTQGRDLFSTLGTIGGGVGGFLLGGPTGGLFGSSLGSRI